MKIARYIGDLLYDYECVVIPGLGGFITSETPATINRVTHYFKPPFKKIFFNSQLRANDGLLVNYIAKEQGLTYKEAKSEIDKFVFLCHEALKSGKRINFHKIGYIYTNDKENIVFEQDTTINYDAESFGLTSFVSPAVRRLSNEEKLKEKVTGKNIYTENVKPQKKPSDRKTGQPGNMKTGEKQQPRTRHMKAEVKHSTFKTQLAFLIVILLGIAIGAAIMNKDAVKVYYNKYASSVPLFYRWANSFYADNLDKIHFVEFSKSTTGQKLAMWFENNINGETGSEEMVAKENTSVATGKDDENEQPVKTAENNLTDKDIEEPETAAENINPVQEAGIIPDIMPDNGNSDAGDGLELTKPVSKAVTDQTKPDSNKPDDEVTTLPETDTQLPSASIYIIAGSFKNLHNARKLVKRLNAKGYPALIADTNRYGMYRVAYAGFFDAGAAKQKLADIRKRENHSAWIMYK